MEENEIYEIPSEMSDLLDEKYNGKNENYRKNIVTKVAYLIGVADKSLENESKFVFEDVEILRNDENATIIRHLCILRSQFFRNYCKISEERYNNYKQIEELNDYLSIDSIKYLCLRGLEVARVSDKPNPAVNVAYINQYLQDNIDKIKDIFPDWVKFKYIRALFLMPKGYAGKNGDFLKRDYYRVVGRIKEVSEKYAKHNRVYPYQMYLTWPSELDGSDKNILYHDLKFLEKLYEANYDEFTSKQYVVDAKLGAKQDIYKFVNDAMNIEVYVDCENVDPYAFAATLKNLDNNNLAKIMVINLYDDAHTSTAWDYISEIIDIPVEHFEVERVLENKSLVDIAMALDIQKKYYESDVDSAILVSSDSDFWAVIEKLDKVNFYVLNEYKKTSQVIIDTLDSHGVPHCYIGNFAQDVVQGFKSEVLYLGLESRIREFNETGTFMPLDVDELIDELFKEAYINGEETQIKKEKESFFNKYFKNGFWIKPVLENGERKLKIELKRK